MSQEEWNEKKRSERHNEFAPPTSSSYGFHSGGSFYLDKTPIQRKKSPEQPSKSKRVSKMDALTIPRKNTTQRRPRYSSSSSDDEVIGPMPVQHVEKFKKQKKETPEVKLPDVSIPPPGYSGFSFPPPTPNWDYPTPVPPPKIPATVTSTSQVPPAPVPAPSSWRSSFNPVTQDTDINKPKPKSRWSDKPPEESSSRGKGVEIAPPTSMEYHIGLTKKSHQKPVVPKKKEVESSIAAGLSFLRKQVEDKQKNKSKGLFDD